jgi:hypothetical protein
MIWAVFKYTDIIFLIMIKMWFHSIGVRRTIERFRKEEKLKTNNEYIGYKEKF